MGDSKMTKAERNELAYMAEQVAKAEARARKTRHPWYAEEAESLSRTYDVMERLYTA